MGRGYDVHIMIRETSNKWRIKDIVKDITEHVVDLRDYDSLRKIVLGINPGIIYHLATYGGHWLQQDMQEIIQSNIIGTVNLLNACAMLEFDCFVNTGSSSEYGLKSQAMVESDLLAPITNYGASKAAATLFCQVIASEHDLPVVSLRLFSPYGPYEEASRLIPTVVLASLSGEDPRLSSGGSVRDFIFIDDVLDLYLKVIEFKLSPGEVFNVGSGTQHLVSEVVDKIIALTEANIQPIYGSFIRPIVEPETWKANLNKTIKMLKWEPKIDMDQGLKKTIEWFRQHSDLNAQRG